MKMLWAGWLRSFVDLPLASSHHAKRMSPETPASDLATLSEEAGGRYGRKEHLRLLLTSGDPSFGEVDAVEVLLGFALPRTDVHPVAAKLIQTFGSLEGVFSASPTELAKVIGVNDASVALLKAVDWLTKRRSKSSGSPLAKPSAKEPFDDTPPAPVRLFQPLLPVPDAQVEFSLGAPPRATEPTTTAPTKAIQDVLLTEGLLAGKVSVDCQSLEQLQEVLLKKLGKTAWRHADVTHSRFHGGFSPMESTGSCDACGRRTGMKPSSATCCAIHISRRSR
jgi:hypothetical protein